MNTYTRKSNKVDMGLVVKSKSLTLLLLIQERDLSYDRILLQHRSN